MNYARKNMIMYQLIILVMFLIAITVTESMDVTLPVYILLVFMPYLDNLRFFNSRFTFIVFLVSIIYLVYGILFQDTRSSIVTFCSRLLQFLVLLWFYENPFFRSIQIETKRVIYMTLIIESFLGLYLYFTSDMTASSGLIRLVAGNQPVGGNFTIVILPLLIYSYYHEPENRRLITAAGFILLLWIVLSGTRGYMLLFGASMALVYVNYWLFPQESGFSMRSKIVAVLVIFSVVLIVLVYTGYIEEFLDSIFRIQEGTGIRESENRLALSTFYNTTLQYKLFGMGLGGTANTVPGYSESVSKIMKGAWEYNAYIDKVGISFHNLFANILFMQGIVGCIVIMCVFVWGLKAVNRCNTVCFQEKVCLYLYWIGFFIMNYYRWSCDCGIAEMIIFSLVLTKLCERNSKQLEERFG